MSNEDKVLYCFLAFIHSPLRARIELDRHAHKNCWMTFEPPKNCVWFNVHWWIQSFDSSSLSCPNPTTLSIVQPSKIVPPFLCWLWTLGLAFSTKKYTAATFTRQELSAQRKKVITTATPRVRVPITTVLCKIFYPISTVPIFARFEFTVLGFQLKSPAYNNYIDLF